LSESLITESSFSGGFSFDSNNMSASQIMGVATTSSYTGDFERLRKMAEEEDEDEEVIKGTKKMTKRPASRNSNKSGGVGSPKTSPKTKTRSISGRKSPAENGKTAVKTRKASVVGGTRRNSASFSSVSTSSVKTTKTPTSAKAQKISVKIPNTSSSSTAASGTRRQVI